MAPEKVHTGGLLSVPLEIQNLMPLPPLMDKYKAGVLVIPAYFNERVTIMFLRESSGRKGLEDVYKSWKEWKAKERQNERQRKNDYSWAGDETRRRLQRLDDIAAQHDYEETCKRLIRLKRIEKNEAEHQKQETNNRLQRLKAMFR